jgi:hypothetical protein
MATEKVFQELAGSMIRHRFFILRPALAAWFALCFGAVVFLGCSSSDGDHPPVYSVKGKVLFKGAPVSSGVVLFELEGGDQTPSNGAQPGGGPLRASGQIAPDGSFHLIAYQGADGVPAGNYKVGISSVPPRTEGNILEASASAKKGNPDVLHGKYADPKTSGLKAEVFKDKANEPTFDLK